MSHDQALDSTVYDSIGEVTRRLGQQRKAPDVRTLLRPTEPSNEAKAHQAPSSSEVSLSGGVLHSAQEGDASVRMPSWRSIAQTQVSCMLLGIRSRLGWPCDTSRGVQSADHRGGHIWSRCVFSCLMVCTKFSWRIVRCVLGVAPCIRLACH